MRRLPERARSWQDAPQVRALQGGLAQRTPEE